MSYYIRGNKERGAEVIALLKSKGGIDTGDLFGRDSQTLYYIGRENRISSTFENSAIAYLVTKYLTELTLPIKKIWEPKFKLGDYYRSKSTSNIGEITDIDSDGFYIVHLLGYSPGGMENEENIEPWEPKQGERVLVKNCVDWVWEDAIFSFVYTYPNSKIQYHAQGGNIWDYCIPFDENKLGKVTD